MDLRAAEHSKLRDGSSKPHKPRDDITKTAIESCALYFSSCVLLSMQMRWWFVGREERGKPSF